MNLHFAQSVSKWLAVLLLVAVTSLVTGMNDTDISIDTSNKSENTKVTTFRKTIEHDTKVVYNSKVKKGVTSILVAGIDGIIEVQSDDNSETTIQPMVTEVIEIGTAAPIVKKEIVDATVSKPALDQSYTYKGTLTGYGPDCIGCSEVGNVACRTREKKAHSLINDGIYYNDKYFGDVRILAATHKVFPCGTIVYVDNGVLEPFYGVVLDTGYSMRNAYDKYGKIWFDLAFASGKEVKNATSKNTVFNVQRWGW